MSRPSCNGREDHHDPCLQPGFGRQLWGAASPPLNSGVLLPSSLSASIPVHHTSSLGGFCPNHITITVRPLPNVRAGPTFRVSGTERGKFSYLSGSHPGAYEKPTVLLIVIK